MARQPWLLIAPAVNHLIASANQNVTINIPREKPKQWPPCSSLKLKHSNRDMDWRIPNFKKKKKKKEED